MMVFQSGAIDFSVTVSGKGTGQSGHQFVLDFVEGDAIVDEEGPRRVVEPESRET
jgi:hypothetical protein